MVWFNLYIPKNVLLLTSDGSALQKMVCLCSFSHFPRPPSWRFFMTFSTSLTVRSRLEGKLVQQSLRPIDSQIGFFFQYLPVLSLFLLLVFRHLNLHTKKSKIEKEKKKKIIYANDFWLNLINTFNIFQILGWRSGRYLFFDFCSNNSNDLKLA